MLELLIDVCSLLAVAVFACVGGVLLGMGFLLLKLLGLLLGLLVGGLLLMGAVWDCVSHLMGG